MLTKPGAAERKTREEGNGSSTVSRRVSGPIWGRSSIVFNILSMCMHRVGIFLLCLKLRNPSIPSMSLMQHDGRMAEGDMSHYYTDRHFGGIRGPTSDEK